MGTAHRSTHAGRTLAVTLAGLALGAGALGACSSGSGDASAGGAPTVTVTSTTAPPTTGSDSATTASGSATTSAPATTASGTSAPAATGSTPAAGSTTACTASQTSVRVEAQAGGGSAGHQAYDVIVTNTGTTECTIQGYPGLSMVAPSTGKQLGRAADRVAGETPLMRLEPGKSAVAPFQLTQAANYGASCGIADASGFRVYLPGETHADYAPLPVKACTNADLKLLALAPFNA